MPKKADWILRIELSRFFDKHKHLRVRVKKGALEDTIYPGVFDSKLRAEFGPGEIIQAEKVGFIVRKQIHDGSAIRTVWGFTDAPCQYQPTWYKRWYGKVKTFLAEQFGS